MSRVPPAAVPPAGLHRRDARRRRTFSLRGLLARIVATSGEGTDWISRLFGLLALTGVGIVIGTQYVAPEKRTITVLIAAVLFALAWRIDLISGIGVLLFAMPFPRGTSIGSTNVVLVVLMSIIWLLRVSLRRLAPPQRTPVDAPLIALLLSFVVSFYNVRARADMGPAIENFGHLLACLAMFYLVVNIIRTPEHLHRVHLLQALSVAVVSLLGIYELIDPTAVVVPGWIEFFHGPRSEAINIHNLRIGGPFTDFELFSEYFALNILLLFGLMVRARQPALKFALIGVLGLCWIGIFATLTRGGILALGVGILYLAWLQRRKLNAVSVGLGIVALVASFQIMDYLIANFTQSGDLLARFLDPQSLHFKNGMPEARSMLWQAAFERMMEHPIIGHGPVYTIQREIGFYFWPHNGYLYIGNLVGLVGLGFFLWLLYRLWTISRPIVRDLNDPNYARAYLLIGHVQLLVFMVDQTKIEFMRNPVYPFQVWMMFASIVAAHRLARTSPAPAASR
jgi:hypothetical protein